MSVQLDVLDDILSMIRLEGTLYFQQVFNGDWGIAVPETPFKKFHIIAQGQCWMRAAFLTEPLWLDVGDIVAFPHGDSYQLSASPDSPTRLLGEFAAGNSESHSLGEASPGAARIIFGHIAVLREFNHPIVRNLPPLIHVRTSEERYRAWLGTVADMLITETRSTLPGSRSVGKRLAEVLHLYMLRAHVLAQQENYQGVFNDPQLYQALQLIHSAPENDWKLEDIARQIGMSRTSFATRFHDLIGMTPMRYITMWRLQKARELLETTDLTIDRIAERVGYQSEAAFTRAFQREFGKTPGRSRGRTVQEGIRIDTPS